MRLTQIMGFRRAAIMAGMLLWATVSAAVTVHTWVDAEGVRHFADAPPVGDATTEASEITLDVGASLAPGDADYYSISNQWQRLRAEREAQHAVELERRRLDDASSEPPPPSMRDEEPRPVFYPNYYGLPPRFGPLYPRHGGDHGPPSPRNAKVNTPPPVWPRER